MRLPQFFYRMQCVKPIAPYSTRRNDSIGRINITRRTDIAAKSASLILPRAYDILSKKSVVLSTIQHAGVCVSANFPPSRFLRRSHNDKQLTAHFVHRNGQ